MVNENHSLVTETSPSLDPFGITLVRTRNESLHALHSHKPPPFLILCLSLCTYLHGLCRAIWNGKQAENSYENVCLQRDSEQQPVAPIDGALDRSATLTVDELYFKDLHCLAMSIKPTSLTMHASN